MRMIEQFLENVNAQGFDILIKTRKSQKTYNEFMSDVNKTIIYLKHKNIQKNSKALLLINMSYEMYVFLVASIFYGLQVVVIDNFKDRKRVNRQIIDANIDYVFTNHLTSLLKNIFKPLRKIKTINISKILKSKEKSFNIEYNIDYKAPCLITFTSGGTGVPKPVSRTLNDLEKQLNKTLEVVKSSKNEYVLATLPIYTLACLVVGLKVYIPSRNENIDNILKKEKPTMIFSSISNYLKVQCIAPSVKKILFGGSILYYQEALKIKKLFPNASSIYIYGATESSIISTTQIEDYIDSLEKNELCLGHILDGNEIEIIDDEIVVKKGIITNDYLNEKKMSFHPTKDLGYVKNNQVYLKGRKINDDIKSDYLLEMIVKKEFEDIFNIAILQNKDQYHIYLEEKDEEKRLKIIFILEKYIKNGIIHIVKKLPLDYRHQAKVDYKKLLNEGA